MEFKDCFISYSHKDETQVLDIVNRLKDKGYTVLIDELFSAGENWKEKAYEYVLSTRCTIVFVSDNSIVSKPVLEEMEVAKQESLRDNYHYFAVLLDNEPIGEKYRKIKQTTNNVGDVVVASKLYDLLPDESIYILNNSNVINSICDSLSKYGILPQEDEKETKVVLKPSATTSFSFVSFEKEITLFKVPNDEVKSVLKEKNFADCNGDTLYRLVLLPTLSKNDQVNFVYAKEIKLINNDGDEIFHEFINRIDCNYSENVLGRGYNCINLDLLVTNNFGELFRNTKRIELNLEIESIHSIVTYMKYVIYLNGEKDNSNNQDIDDYKDMITMKIHHVKAITLKIQEKI